MGKLFSTAAVSLCVALSAAACGLGPESWTKPVRVIEAREVRVAMQPTAYSAPLFVAKRKGWLDEELRKVGVSVKWSYFLSGPPMSASLAVGAQDIGLMGDAAAILGRASRHQIRIVGIGAAAPAGRLEKPVPTATAEDLKTGITVIVAANAFASRNPGLVSIFLQVYERAKDWIRENPAEAAKLVSIEVNRPSAELVPVLAGLDFDPHVHDDDIAKLKRTERLLRHSGLLASPVDIASFLGAGRLRVERIP